VALHGEEPKCLTCRVCVCVCVCGTIPGLEIPRVQLVISHLAVLNIRPLSERRSTDPTRNRVNQSRGRQAHREPCKLANSCQRALKSYASVVRGAKYRLIEDTIY
jgi:hypothetical protein